MEIQKQDFNPKILKWKFLSCNFKFKYNINRNNINKIKYSNFWTPSLLIQAEDRAHRIRHEYSFHDEQIFIWKKTLDKYMFERLKKINFLWNTLDNFKNTLNKGIWKIKLLSILIILVTFCK